MITSNNAVLLHISLIEGFGAQSLYKLLMFLLKQQEQKHLKSFVLGEITKLLCNDLDLSVVYTMTISDVQQAGFSQEQAALIVTGLQSRKHLNDELALLEKHHDIKLISLLDITYPHLLRHIHVPPVLLYVRGSIVAEHPKRLAVVGARLADQYAQQVIHAMVPTLVDSGWQIVSGGARGADTFAHESTLHAGGQTIAVLGSGLLQPYPTQNITLFSDIVAQGGSVISPFRLLKGPDRITFPIRNRIIAGLSQGCLVVQAAAKSGALITAEFALEQGRQVFAVPGSIFHPLSAGCHKLLAMGASMATDVESILREFGQEVASRVVQQTIFNDGVLLDASLLRTSVDVTVEYCISDLKKTARPEEPKGRLEGFERTQEESDPVLRILHEQLSLDQISVKTGMTFTDLQNKLFELQLEGKVLQTFSGLWERV